MRAEHPTVEHPIVRTHPETGRKTLYVNVGFTRSIVGMDDPRRAKPLLHRLYRQSTIVDVQCRFRWRPGSVAFWDNRATQHVVSNEHHGRCGRDVSALREAGSRQQKSAVKHWPRRAGVASVTSRRDSIAITRLDSANPALVRVRTTETGSHYRVETGRSPTRAGTGLARALLRSWDVVRQRAGCSHRPAPCGIRASSARRNR